MDEALRNTRGRSQIGRGAEIAASIQDELAFRGDVDVEKLISSGFSWCRYLEPRPATDLTLTQLVASAYSISAGFALLADRDFSFQLPRNRCALVSQTCIEWTGAGTGAGRVRWFALNKSGSVNRPFGGSVAAADMVSAVREALWVPPGEGLLCRVVYTGGGGAGNEITGTIGMQVKLFPAGMFPLC